MGERSATKINHRTNPLSVIAEKDCKQSTQYAKLFAVERSEQQKVEERSDEEI